MNQLSQIVILELNMFRLTVGNKIVTNLNDTLIFTLDCSRGINMKSKFIQKLVDLDYLSTYMNDATIFYFCSQQGDYLFLLTQPNQQC